MHGGTAVLAQSVPVHETFDGKPVWEGVVHVFDLTGHPTRPAPTHGPRRSRVARSGVYCVLHTERIELGARSGAGGDRG